MQGKGSSLFLNFLTFLGIDTSPKHLRFSNKSWLNLGTKEVLKHDNDTEIFVPDDGKSLSDYFFPAIDAWPLTGKKIISTAKFSFKKSSDGKFYKFIFPFSKDIDFYGGGESVGPLRRNGTKSILWATDNFAYMKFKGRRLYQSHPFIMGVKKDGSAFGLIFCTTFPSQLEIKNIGVLEFKSYGQSFPVIKFDAQSPQDILKKLAYFTGKMELPPLWALGYQQCRWSYYPDSRVKEIADEFRNRNLPCDVIWLDIHYMNGYRIFTFDDKLFPNPKELFKYLHNKNFKAVCMIDPAPKNDSKYFVFKDGLEKDLFVHDANGETFIGNVWPGECAFPDYTMDETNEWWQNLYKDFMANGIDGIWNDMNEPSVFDAPDGTMPIDNIHRGGKDMPAGTHLQYHNVYGMLMVKSSKNGIKKAAPKKRPFVLSRSNFLGGQKYAAVWTGDNISSQKDLLLSIPMCVNLGLSGQPFSGVDVGGFGGIGTGELMSDWMGIAAFFPLDRGHAAILTNDKEPWAYGVKVENSCRVSLERRYAILPYLYTAFFKSSQSGCSILNPAFFADLTNPNLRGEEVAFMLGEDLYIKPQFEKRVKKNILVPSGNWAEITVASEETSKDKSLPKIFLREGAILPTITPIQSTVDYNLDNLVLLINPTENGEACCDLYFDSGDGYDYQSGKYALIHFSCASVKNGWKVKVSGESNFKIKNCSVKVFTKGRIYCSDNLIVIK